MGARGTEASPKHPSVVTATRCWPSWPRLWRSLATIILTRVAKSTSGCQPSLFLALVASPISRSTSAGRKNLASWRTKRCQSSMPTSAKARSTTSPTVCALAGGHDVVVGLVLLQHQPHRPHVIPGVPPVPFGVERAHHQLVLQPEADPRRRIGHLASHELDPPTWPLVVEQDPRTGEQPVALPIVHGDVVAEHLGAAIRRTRMERRHLVLRRLTHLAEHLRRRRLIEADRVVLRPPDHADRLEHPQHPQPRRVRRQLGLREAQRDERDRPQVVHLVGLGQLQRRHQRRQISEITRHQLDERHLLDDLQPPSGCSAPSPSHTRHTHDRARTRPDDGHPDQ